MHSAESRAQGSEFRWLYHGNLTKEPEDFRLLDIPRIGRTLCVHRSVDRLLGRAAIRLPARMPRVYRCICVHALKVM